MRALRRLLQRLAASLSSTPNHLDADELHAHVEMQAAEYVRRGASPGEARRRARAESGGVTAALERVREERRLPWVDTTVSDIRYALRSLRHHPVYVVVTVLTLALGIGGITTMFGVVDGVLLRPLPYPGSDRLITITSVSREGPMAVSARDFADWRDQVKSLDGLVASYESETILTGDGEPERLSQARVSANLFDVLRVRPLLGRSFTRGEEEVTAPRVAMLGERVWQNRFGGDSSVVGRTITLDGFPVEVIGIAPRAVSWPFAADVWMTTRFTSRDLAQTARGARWLSVIGRVRDGVTVDAAGREMVEIARRLEQLDPRHNDGVTASVTPLLDDMVGGVQRALFILFGSVGFVLLIACANVASLSLGRMASRNTEFAVRKALGASRGRILRQTITESLVIAVIGGIAGAAVAMAGIRGLVAIAPATLPRMGDVHISMGVLAFTLVATVGTGLLFGTLPALSAAGGLQGRLLVAGSRVATGTPLLRRLIVATEVALAVVLLSGAGLLLRSFARLTAVDPGFDPAGVTIFGVALPTTRYQSPDQQRQFTATLLGGLTQVPGVTATGVSFNLPMSGSSFGFTFDIAGRATDPRNEPRAQARVVNADYFTAMRIPLLRGRMFDARDRAGAAQSVIVSEELARLYFPNENPIGKQLKTGWSQGGEGRFGGEIVGVVGSVRQAGFHGRPSPHIYMNYEQWPLNEYTVVMRSRSSTAAAIAGARSVLHGIDRNLPLIDARAYSDLVDASLGGRRFYLDLLGMFAVVALALAAVGTYGVIAYGVQMRRREIGIRLALGATQGGIIRMVMGQGFRLVAAGAVVGTVATFGLSRVIQSLLFGVDPRDPTSLLGAPALLLAIALSACLIPARQAGRLDPNRTIRDN
jgi:predicted permease